MLDHEVIGKFKEFQKKTGKYLDLIIEDVRFEKISLSDNKYFAITMGQSPKGESLNNISDGIPFYQGKTDFGKVSLEKPTAWTSKSKKEAKIDDILITLRAPAGVVNFANIDLSIGRGLASIRCFINIERLYIFYFLKNNENKINIENDKGGFFSSMTKDYLHAVQIPIPANLNTKYTSLKLQKIIVEFLEHGFSWLDRIKTNIDKQDSIYKRLRKSLIPSTFKKDYIKIRFAKYAEKYNIDFDITDTEFEINDFNNFFETVTPPRKIKSKKTKKIANFPVVSQSDGLINGYTDEANGMIEAKDSPIILFGDHSTIVKYIDFNFFAGADGTKILKPLENILPLFAYYQTVNKVKQMGYQRHFQYLKEKKFLIPKSLKKYTSYEIQKIIADFINEVDDEIEKSFDKINKGYDAVKRYKRAYLYKTFSKIDWSK